MPEKGSKQASRLAAGARHERMLFPVGWTPLFGLV